MIGEGAPAVCVALSSRYVYRSAIYPGTRICMCVCIYLVRRLSGVHYFYLLLRHGNMYISLSTLHVIPLGWAGVRSFSVRSSKSRPGILDRSTSKSPSPPPPPLAAFKARQTVGKRLLSRRAARVWCEMCVCAQGRDKQWSERRRIRLLGPTRY